MAAATQVPAGTWISKGKCAELVADVNTLVTLGVVGASDTITTLLANLATEQATR